jgi:hypothetical protein
MAASSFVLWWKNLIRSELETGKAKLDEDAEFTSGK